MKELFYTGGPMFMAVLTILLIITTAWIIYHFVVAYNSKQTTQEKFLRKIGYGKSLGLFTMTIGILGQMSGFYHMFLAIEEAIGRGEEVNPALVFGAIKVTMICTSYGILIYLFSFVLWFVATTIIEKSLKD